MRHALYSRSGEQMTQVMDWEEEVKRKKGGKEIVLTDVLFLHCIKKNVMTIFLSEWEGRKKKFKNSFYGAQMHTAEENLLAI